CFAPAAGAGGGAVALAVADGTGAGDDVDAVGAGQRAGPAADHVVVAGVAAVAQDRFGEGLQQRGGVAVFAVGGQAEERMGDVGRRVFRGGQHVGHAVGEDGAHAVQADVRMVGGAPLRFGQQLAVAV